MDTTHEGLAIGHTMADLAADNAGSDWREAALTAFENHARQHTRFTTEEVRLASTDVPAPPDMRAWGAVARAACRAGIVESDGWVRANSRTVHGMVVTSWRSKICRN